VSWWSTGARQVGKSTLAELIVAGSPGARELYLDDQAVRAAAEADPSAFVRHDGLLMIDESSALRNCCWPSNARWIAIRVPAGFC
jgi:hypothetical protein